MAGYYNTKGVIIRHTNEIWGAIMFNMPVKTKILPEAQQELWPLLKEVPDHFVLYGGTAIIPGALKAPDVTIGNEQQAEA